MGRGPSKRILLIDADPAVHADLREILCAGDLEGGDRPAEPAAILQDLQLDAVCRGTEGLQQLRDALQEGRPYLAAVVDFQPSGEPHAVETVQQLWDEDPALPVLLLTPHDCTVGQREEIGRRLGQSDRFLFLSKPLAEEEVRRLVAVQLDRRMAQRKVQEMTAELYSLRRNVEQTREEAERAGRAKNEFMANISHEIRTPMNAILGFTRLLMKERPTEGQAEKLRYVHEAGTSLLNVIDNVLDYSKLTAGQLDFTMGPFNLDSVIWEVIEATRAAAHEKGLAVEYHIVEAVPRWLQGDKTRFRQILVNLVANAIKFTVEGTIHIQITPDEETEEDTTLRVVVTDTGVGIPAERQAVMFESFSQADGSLTRKFGGLGLGLAICKRLVDLMGGQIGFRSDPHQGSSFWLTVTLKKHRGSHPAEPTTPARPMHEDAGGPAAKGDGKPRVLVADDDHLNRTLAEMLLTRAGCLVDLAGNGREALAVLNQAQYDLVLMDIDMPEMDGLETIEHIRSEETATGRRVPIVALTAHALSGDRQRCLDAGADEYVAKPFTPEELLGMVQRYLPVCLEPSGPQGTTAGSRASAGRSDPPHTLNDYLQDLCAALSKENFHEVENSAGALKSLSLQTGLRPVADHAMRVQLAARSHDLKRTARAVQRLQAALHEHQPAAATPETAVGANP